VATRTRPRPAPADGRAGFDAAWDRLFDSMIRARARGVREVGELTYSQLHLLAALADRSPRSVGELAELAGVAPPSATRMLDGLARAGVVERRPSTTDRRVVEVFLTDEGRRIVRRKRSRIAAKRRALFDSLAPDERGHAERLLDRLAGVMDEL
jgi:DNA-binding MarR family transcriptional regulator